MTSRRDIKVLKGDVLQALEGLVNAVASQNCLRCLNFQEGQETCLLYNARPPARIIVHGCESWEDDIPF